MAEQIGYKVLGNGSIAAGRLEGEPQACGKDLEDGRIESTTETAKTGAAMDERWLLHKAASGVQEPCMELRFHDSSDMRWQGLSDTHGS